MRARNDKAAPNNPAMCWSAQACARRYESEGNRAFYRAAMARLLEGAPGFQGQGIDLGCGTGFSTEVLLAERPRVAWHAIDASAAMLAIARGKPGLAQVDLRQACAEALPYADASFDVVVASFSWHWFGERAGQEVRRVLRPGGYVLAGVPVRRASRVRGNRLLARELLARRRRFVAKTSQGLRFAEVPRLLPGPFRVARHELVVETERFADGRELLDVLDSRGALAAIFGESPPAVLEAAGSIDFEWPYAVLHAQI
ncbi:MAG: class I SAM-dependent methyltransferase [Deltaproteobacteria bacterium]|nr:class I SAM-dependent methyltransferase [Deltaproteobacteria bacterium]